MPKRPEVRPSWLRGSSPLSLPLPTPSRFSPPSFSPAPPKHCVWPSPRPVQSVVSHVLGSVVVTRVGQAFDQARGTRKGSDHVTPKFSTLAYG